MQKKQNVVILLLGYFILQLFYITRFPDSDIDAYVHFIAARLLYHNPLNLSAHWVWLPFYHYLLTLFIWIGFSFQAVRFFSVSVWAISGILLYRLVSQRAIENASQKAFIALAFFLFMPTAIISASSVEPEALFTFLMLGAVYAGEKKRYSIAGLALGIACIIRYEAWIMAAGYSMYIAWQGRHDLKSVWKAKAAWLIIIPVLCLGSWLFAKWLYQKETMTFVTGTKSFAETYTDVKPEYFPAWFQWFFDATFYVLYIPLLASGPFLYFAYRGVKNAWREYSLMAATSFACLLFISIAWWLRYSLGLFRHFTVILPFFAICLSLGLTDYMKKRKQKLEGAAAVKLITLKRNYVIGKAIFCSIIIVLLIAAYIGWSSHLESFFADRKDMAQVVTALPDSANILCSDNTVEIFSGKNSKQFTRLWADTSDYSKRMLLKYAAENHGGYIVIPEQVFRHFQGLFGEKVSEIHTTYHSTKASSLTLLKIKE